MPDWAGHKGNVSLGEENRDRKKNAHNSLLVRPGLRETGQEAVLPGPSFWVCCQLPSAPYQCGRSNCVLTPTSAHSLATGNLSNPGSTPIAFFFPTKNVQEHLLR